MTLQDKPVGAATPEAAPVAKPAARRIVGLDGPRGLACAAVLVLHVNAHYSPKVMDAFKLQLLGQALVFFFALSGFLLYLPFVRAILAEPAAAKWPDTRVFGVHRLLRVFPAYLTIFLISSLVFGAVYLENVAIQPPGTDAGTGRMTDPGALVANLTLLQSYLPQYFQTGLNPSWSLSLELVFYLSLPVFGAMALALRRRTALAPIPVALLAPLILIMLGALGKALAPVVQQWVGVNDPNLAEWGPNWLAVYNRSFVSLADNFAFGMIAAVLFAAIGTGLLTGHVVRRLRWYCVPLLLAAAAASLVLIALHSHVSSTAVALLSALLILFIVAPLARGEHSRFAAALDWAPLRYVGEISLSVYLWHFPVLLVLGRHGLMAGDTVAGMLRNVALVLAVSLVLASLTHRFVEKPAMAVAKRYRR
ncbi:acyltransferase [Mycobacterium sp. DL592]|uniref:acyltransferase family protein n=1 Tax=Mycobacterium sp. DL592 TaxID=2675524 RepID=UPI001421D6C7|nr:acyltransferase [Mycobacterium sp. DL592]